MHCTESYVWSRDVLLQGEAPAAHSERVDQSNRNGARVVHTESEKGWKCLVDRDDTTLTGHVVRRDYSTFPTD